MHFPDFNPVLIQIGPIAVRWYALAYVAGILLGWRYAVAMVKTPRIWRGVAPTADEKQVDDYVLWVALGVVGGGRLGSILFYDTSVIWTNPMEILKPWHGGMSFHGGLIGVTIAILVFARANKINVFSLADLTAPCVPIGLFFGRIANFINGELWGPPDPPALGDHLPARRYRAAPSQPAVRGRAGGDRPVLPAALGHPRGQAAAAAGLCHRPLPDRLRLRPDRAGECARAGPRHAPLPLRPDHGIMLSVPMVIAGLAIIAYAMRPQSLAPGARPADGGVDALGGATDPMQSLAADASEAGSARRRCVEVSRPGPCRGQHWLLQSLSAFVGQNDRL